MRVSPTRSALFVINPLARGLARWPWATLRARLAASGLDCTPVFTEHRGQATALARVAAARYPLIVAAGGDGTVNEVANGLLEAGAQGILGILPLGTGNDIARQLGIPSVQTALATLEQGTVRRLDAIEVRLGAGSETSHRFALQFVAVGLIAQVLAATSPGVKRWGGRRLSYAVGLLRTLRHPRAGRMTVRTEGFTSDASFLHVCAANCAEAGGGLVRLAPGARPDDGWLDVCTVGALGRWAVLGQLPRLASGGYLGHPKATQTRATWLEVVGDPPTDVALDGELAGPTPVRLTLRPRALAVQSPVPFSD